MKTKKKKRIVIVRRKRKVPLMKNGITVEARLENLDEVQAFVDGELEKNDCPAKARYQIALAVEEIFVNIASYAYAPEDGTGGTADISISFGGEQVTAEIVFSDRGKPFDPTAKEDADTSPDALLEREGGLGILMTKKLMDDVTYSRVDGKNVLTVRKTIG